MVKTVSFLFKGIMIIITAIVCIAYAVTALIPYLDTGRYWMISILGLGFPIICGLLVLLILFWVLVRSKMWIPCVVILLLGYQQIFAAFAFHWPSGFRIEKNNESIRVLQWNVHNWNQVLYDDERNFKSDAQPHMMALIKKYSPDVVCFEEFFESIDPKKNKPSNIAALRAMGYSYYFFAHGDLREEYYYEGIAIFSKYPLADTGRIVLAPDSNVDPLAFADVDAAGQRVRVMAVHLQSVKFIGTDYSNLTKMKRVEDPSISGGKTILGKLKRGFRKRYDQSVSVRRSVQESPYPVVLCGDFNDVPNSGVYFNIRKNLQDAFLRQGTFIGRTFRFISPTLRIDYIMPSRNFKVEQCKTIRAAYSDHYPVVADVKIK